MPPTTEALAVAQAAAESGDVGLPMVVDKDTPLNTGPRVNIADDEQDDLESIQLQARYLGDMLKNFVSDFAKTLPAEMSEQERKRRIEAYRQEKHDEIVADIHEHISRGNQSFFFSPKYADLKKQQEHEMAKAELAGKAAGYGQEEIKSLVKEKKDHWDKIIYLTEVRFRRDTRVELYAAQGLDLTGILATNFTHGISKEQSDETLPDGWEISRDFDHIDGKPLTEIQKEHLYRTWSKAQVITCTASMDTLKEYLEYCTDKKIDIISGQEIVVYAGAANVKWAFGKTADERGCGVSELEDSANKKGVTITWISRPVISPDLKYNPDAGKPYTMYLASQLLAFADEKNYLGESAKLIRERKDAQLSVNRPWQDTKVADAFSIWLSKVDISKVDKGDSVYGQICTLFDPLNLAAFDSTADVEERAALLKASMEDFLNKKASATDIEEFEARLKAFMDIPELEVPKKEDGKTPLVSDALVNLWADIKHPNRGMCCDMLVALVQLALRRKLQHGNKDKKLDLAEFFKDSYFLGMHKGYEQFIMSDEKTLMGNFKVFIDEFANNEELRDYLNVLIFCEAALSGGVDDKIWEHELAQRILKDAWEKSVELHREGYDVPDIEAIRRLVNQHLCNDGPHQVPEAERTIPTAGVAALAKHNKRTDEARKLKLAISGAVGWEKRQTRRMLGDLEEASSKLEEASSQLEEASSKRVKLSINVAPNVAPGMFSAPPVAAKGVGSDGASSAPAPAAGGR